MAMNFPPTPSSFPHPVQLKEKQSQDLPKGTGKKRSQAKRRSGWQNPFPSLLPAPEPSRGTWHSGSSSSVRSRLRVSVQDRSRQPEAGFGWRLSLWLCFPSRGRSYSLPIAVSRGASERGTLTAAGCRRGWDGYGVPPGHGVPEERMEERKAAEAGDGLEARRCGCAPLRPGPHRDEREGKGRGDGEGSWGPPKAEPQPGLTPARCREGGSQGGRTAGQAAPSYEY